jgi:hypothetical protein
MKSLNYIKIVIILLYNEIIRLNLLFVLLLKILTLIRILKGRYVFKKG